MKNDISAQTEEYINQEEQYKINWKARYGSYIDEAYALATECLKTKSPDAKKNLLKFFENKELIQEISQVNDFAYIAVMMEIYSLEQDNDIQNDVFQWADDVQGMIDIIKQVKFLLWEIEFLEIKESRQLLVNFLDDVGISMRAFEYIVFISSFDKRKMVECLGEIL